MSEQLYHVTCSEGADPNQPEIVSASNLRAHLHSLFCMCDEPETCDNEYLADLDDYDEEELVRCGAHWDLEDGWVSVEPIGAST